MRSVFTKPASKISVVAQDARYDVVFENVFEVRNTRDDDPMVTYGRNYSYPIGKQQITIVPTSRPNYFKDYSELSVELDNELAAEFELALREEPDMVMWFAKDMLSYANKHGKLI